MRIFGLLLAVLLVALTVFSCGAGEVDMFLDIVDDPLVQAPFRSVHRLDPTAKRVAWFSSQDALVLLELDSGELSAIPFPEWMGTATDFCWSPDGERIALAEDVFRYLYEPDIWVADLAAQTFSNCSNDMAFGSIVRAEEPFWIDVLPTWRSEDDLAFIRIGGYSDDSLVELRHVNASECKTKPGVDSGCCELVCQLSPDFPGGFSILGVPSLASDGTELAVITQGVKLNQQTDGLWVFDTETGDTRLFVPTSAFRAGFPDWFEQYPIVPRDVAWIQDGRSLLVFAEDVSGLASWPRMNLYVVDAEDGSVEPFASYEGYADGPSFYRPGEDGQTGVLSVPLQAIVLPDGLGMITVHQETDDETVELRLSSLEGLDEDSKVIGEFEAIRHARGVGPSIVHLSEDGTALVLNRYVIKVEDALIQFTQ